MNEASERDPFNNNCYGTLVDRRLQAGHAADPRRGRLQRPHHPRLRRGLGEKDLPADLSLARSLVPAGTATLRDFSYIAPEIPEYIPENCTGCMDCVTECPDTAILGKVLGESEFEKQARGDRRRGRPRDVSRAVVEDAQVLRRPAKKKRAKAGMFAIIIDPSKCKGCAECVTVCDDDALKMIPKTEEVMTTIRKSHRYFKQIGPVATSSYINDNLLIDMMLKEQTHIYVGGAGSCAGCGEGTALRMLCSATGAKYGDQWGIVAATGCNTVYTSTYPYNPYLVPWTNSLFENAPADAMGVRARWDQMGWQNKPLWCIGGDGAMFDIGFQSLSRMFASGMNIKVFVLDTQVYSNTGGQASTRSYTGQNTKMSVHGKAIAGKQERRKEIAQIAMMHPRTFVAQTTCAHINHFYKSVLGALEFDGPAIVCCYTTCQPEHGVADNMAGDQARLAVDTRAFPLLIYDPRKGDTIRERLSLQGNPAVKDDWCDQSRRRARWSTSSTSARSEGRFAKHFDKEGNPSETLLRAKQDRLENWHVLQELAGLRGPKTKAEARPKAEAQKNETSPVLAPNPQSLLEGFAVGTRIMYLDGAQWVSGVVESLEPAVLGLDDRSKINTSAKVLADGVREGLIVKAK